MQTLRRGFLVSSIVLLSTLAVSGHGAEEAVAEQTSQQSFPAPQQKKRVVIARLWHGRTSSARADEYEHYLGNAITKFTTIIGNLGYQLMRENHGEVTDFCVISYWTSREAIKAYAGEDISRTRSLPRDKEFLIDPEPTVKNYELLVEIRKP